MSETTNSHGRSRQAPRQPEPGGEGQTWAQRTHPQGRPLQAQPTATLAKLRAAACGLTGPLQERPPCPDMLTPLAICNKSGTPCPFPPARRLLIEVPHALREPGYNTLVIGARLGEALDLIAKAREAGWLAAPLEWLTECPPGTIASALGQTRHAPFGVPLASSSSSATTPARSTPPPRSYPPWSLPSCALRTPVLRWLGESSMCRAAQQPSTSTPDRSPRRVWALARQPPPIGTSPRPCAHHRHPLPRPRPLQCLDRSIEASWYTGPPLACPTQTCSAW